jgi:hypothetical protein
MRNGSSGAGLEAFRVALQAVTTAQKEIISVLIWSIARPYVLH